MIVHADSPDGPRDVAQHALTTPGRPSIRDEHYAPRPPGALERRLKAGTLEELAIGPGAAGWLTKAAAAGACGLLVPPEDGEALARGVLTLARDPGRARALGRAGRETARRHARSRQVDRLNELIVEASAKPVPREVNEPSRG